MKRRIAIKIGSNVLTRNDGKLDITRMSSLVDQIADLHRQGIEILLISSGAVASGKSEINIGKQLDAVSSRQLYSAIGQAKLINRYYDLFREQGICCGQVLTTKESFSTRTHKSSFGRGGMLTKCKIACQVAEEGIEVIIANGKRDNILNLILHQPEKTLCTRFVPGEKNVSNIKKWIAHSEDFAKGKIVINAGAEEALSSPKASSILLVGVTHIEGDFEKDDIVRVMNEEGKQIGIGCTAYSSQEARPLIGTKDVKPIIHYNYLYLN